MNSCEPAWTDKELTNPHRIEDKAQRVRAMFTAIAPRYDLNDRLHSLGLDQTWRRKAVTTAEVKPGDVVLDVACGTGDLTLAFSRSRAKRVIGADFTPSMLTQATRKPPGIGRIAPSYHAADATRLPMNDETVDVVSIAFGIRNVADPAKALREFYRVLRPGGRLVILEFNQPTNSIVRLGYNFYFRHVMPRTAAFIAGDRSGAYRYLPRSVSTFLDRPATLNLMCETGFTHTRSSPLTLGIAVIYHSVKPS